MGITTQIEAKIADLHLLKESLLKKQAFLNPENDIVVYSTADLESKGATEGTTPNNLSTALMQVSKQIVGYVDTIRKYPFIEDAEYLVQGARFKIVPSPSSFLDKPMAANLPAAGLASYVVEAEIKTGLSQVAFNVNFPSLLDTEFNVFVTRINTRLNDVTVFNLSLSDGDLVLHSDFINIDDLYLIQIVSILNQESRSMSIPGHFNVLATTQDETINLSYPILSQESVFFDSEDLKEGQSIAWSLLTLNGGTATFFDSANEAININKNRSINTEGDSSLRLSELVANDNYINLVQQNIQLSRSRKTGFFRDLNIVSYDLFESNSNANKVIMKNIVKIDKILEEAFDAL